MGAVVGAAGAGIPGPGHGLQAPLSQSSLVVFSGTEDGSGSGKGFLLWPGWTGFSLPLFLSLHSHV